MQSSFLVDATRPGVLTAGRRPGRGEKPIQREGMYSSTRASVGNQGQILNNTARAALQPQIGCRGQPARSRLSVKEKEVRRLASLQAERRYLAMHRARPLFVPAGLLALAVLVGSGASSRHGGSHSPMRPVALQVGASLCQTSDSIQVTITNQSAQTISFADHQTHCTVIQLQRRVANSWEGVDPCQRMIATRLHTLPAGQRMDVTLMAADQWPAGRYRAKLDYQGGSGVQKTVVSREFRIG